MDHYYYNLGQDWFTYPNLYFRMVKHFKTGSHFVEVGSWKGRSACYMAVEIHNSGKDIKFDCVDTWEGSPEHKDPALFTYEPLLLEEDGLYNEFLKNITPVKHIVKPIRMTSLEASQLYENESLDFVFIDAAHDYENVKNDIVHWLDKVKPGGRLAGHDYEHEDIRRAVLEIFPVNSIEATEGCWVHIKR